MAAAMRDLLTRHRRVAMVGASPRPHRPSNGVMRSLLAAGYDVTPVNPRHDEVLGVPCVPDLAAAAAAGPLEIVDIFRRSEHVPAIVDDAIALGARVVWMQLGVHHPEAADRARAAGLEVVEDRCIAVEVARLAAA